MLLSLKRNSAVVKTSVVVVVEEMTEALCNITVLLKYNAQYMYVQCVLGSRDVIMYSNRTYIQQSRYHTYSGKYIDIRIGGCGFVAEYISIQDLLGDLVF